MRTFLEKLLKYQKPISIYLRHNSSNVFSVGVLEAIRNNEIILKCISLAGEYDGYMWVDLESIYRCEIDGQYEKKIGKLKVEKNKEGIDLEVTSSDNLLQGLLKYAKKQNKLIEISVRNEYFAGYLLHISKESIVIREIDTYGQDDGINCFSMGEVEEVHIDTLTCNEIEKLKNSD